MITREEAVRRIKASKKIFYIEFVKRGDGSLRRMSCLRHVYSYLKGGEQAYDPEDYNLIRVFDMFDRQYKSIPIEGIRHLSMNKTREKVQ